MKPPLPLLPPFPLLPALIAVLLALAVPPSTSAAAKQIYQSPMHPWITSDKPGRCTICGMPLVLVTVDESNGEDGNEQVANERNTKKNGRATVTLSAAQHIVSGIQTASVTRGTLTRTLRVNGTINDDETRHRILAARVPGRVETLHVNYVGAEVREGEPLAALYSPEVLTAQRSYLEHLMAGEAFSATARTDARERLLALGLTESEIRQLETTRQPSAIHTVRAPMSGTVIARAAYEGQYVAVNDPLFEICDFSQMWFIFDLYEPDLAWVRVGQDVEVELPSRPGERWVAPIRFIDPNLNSVTRTARARVVLDNPNRQLLRQQTATATVHASYAERLLVPRSAVLQHSGQAVVFVEEGPRRYAPRAITLGRIGQHAEVLSGLELGERVVVEGGLILDGQAQLAQIKVGPSMPHASRAHSHAHDHDHAHALHETQATATHPHSPTEPTLGAPSHPDGPHTELLAAALTAADAARALADDDLAAYQRQLPALREASRAYLAARPDQSLAALADALLPGADLKQARTAFEPFSTALADLARTAHLHHRVAELHIFQCPMTPVLGMGRWLSRSSELRNPFFGEMMLECGEELH